MPTETARPIDRLLAFTPFHRVPHRETVEHALPDSEVFYSATGVPDEDTGAMTFEPGWYVWACFPGCLPDSTPEGPYESMDAAILAWREGSDPD